MVESNTNEKVDIYKGAINNLLNEKNITFFDENLTGLNVNPQDKKDFLIEHAEKLFTKSFWNYENITRNKNDDIDGDRHIISYAVYWILWGDKLQELKSEEVNGKIKYSTYSDYKINDKRYFSGDTICTFNTIFESESIRWFNKEFNTTSNNTFSNGDIQNPPILSRFSEEELKEINDFRLLYETLGNFYILPSLTIESNISINRYRGSNKDDGWKDYFDTFLNNLDKTLQTNYKENNQDDFSKLLNKNSFFFDENNTLKLFCDFFNLQDFEDYKIDNKHLRACDYNKNNPEEYKSFALDYIKKSTKCIKKRAKRLQEAFVEKLENMDESNFK